jgi:uncharacterized RDD family membrane protein YckC
MADTYASNPYAPPRAAVRDIPDRSAAAVVADRGTRLGAAILDSVIFVMMVYVPMLLAAVIGPAFLAGTEEPDTAFGAVMIVALGVTAVGFIVWCWITIRNMSRNGQSIAKKLLGIKVVRSDGSRASLSRLIWLRNVLNWLFSIIPLYGLVDSLFIFGDSRQCLHDKIADTIVVKA